jgi:hypothetical protein
MLADTLLSVGLLLTTASQLRLGNLPIGPGELCLLGWVFLVSLKEARRLGPPLSPALLRLLIFWTTFVMSLCLGLLTGLFIGQQYDTHWLLHDVLAYPLLAAVSCMSVVEPGAQRRLRRVAWLLIMFGSASLALQVAAGFEIISLPVIQPWFWERFRGWSANPNQLALLCGVLALVALYLCETATTWSSRIVALACSVLPICVGRMTMSDTFTLAVLLAAPLFVGLKVWDGLHFSGLNIMRFAFACTVVIGLPLLTISLIPFGMVTASDAGMFAKEISKNGGKELKQESDLRFSLWTQALTLGVKSAMLGLGPGPHLEIPTSVVVGRMTEPEQLENIEHPQQTSAPNFEAHNTVLDLFTQGGMIAVLSFIWILGVSFFSAHKARLAGLTTLICGVSVFAMTGLIIRQPLFWFSIALCLVAESRSLAKLAPAGESAL